MAGTQRFEPETGCGMEIQPGGDWVRYEDSRAALVGEEEFRDEALRCAVAAHNEKEAERDQLKKDMDRLLEARRRISGALSARAHYEALKNLHKVAQELEDGKKEET